MQLRFIKSIYLKLQILSAACRHGVADDAHQGRLLICKSQFRNPDIMTEHSLWRFSRALHRAINERQPDDLEALIDEDVDWAIYGPIDMFPFLRRAPRQGSRDRGDPADRGQCPGPPLRPRVDHAGRGFRGLDDALFADRAGLEQADQPAARPFRASSRPAGCSASAFWSIPSIWSSRRSDIQSICRRWRR